MKMYSGYLSRAEDLVREADQLKEWRTKGRLNETAFQREYAQLLLAQDKLIREIVAEKWAREKLFAQEVAPHPTLKPCPKCGRMLNLSGTWSRTPHWKHFEVFPGSAGCTFSEIATKDEVEAARLRIE